VFEKTGVVIAVFKQQDQVDSWELKTNPRRELERSPLDLFPVHVLNREPTKIFPKTSARTGCHGDGLPLAAVMGRFDSGLVKTSSSCFCGAESLQVVR